MIWRTIINATQSNFTPGQPLQASDSNERRAKRFWVSLIVGLLGLQVLAGIGTVYLATNDPTVAVIPNYYQAGLDWDVKRRSLNQFQALGWQCEVQIDSVDTELQQRTFKVLVRDSNALPVADLRVTAKVYHHARGTDVHRLILDQTQPGEYVAIARLIQAGLWQVDLSLEGDHGLAEQPLTIDVQSQGVTVANTKDAIAARTAASSKRALKPDRS